MIWVVYRCQASIGKENGRISSLAVGGVQKLGVVNRGVKVEIEFTEWSCRGRVRFCLGLSHFSLLET